MNALFVVVHTFSLLLVVRVAGKVFSPAALGLFLLARRTSSTWGNLFQLGTSKTLLRYISINQSNASTKKTFVLSALGLWLSTVLLGLPMFYLWRVPLTRWLFPSAEANYDLLVWTSVLAFATVIHFITNATLLAERKMVLSNLLELLNSGVFLLVALLLYHGVEPTPEVPLRVQSLAMISLSLVALSVYLVSLGPEWRRAKVQWLDALSAYKEYGMPRVVVPFLDMVTLLVGPWLLQAVPEESAYLIVALTLVRTIQAAIGPLTKVATVVTAHLLGQGNQESVDEGTRLMFGTVLYLTVLAVAVVGPWNNLILTFWLGDPDLVAGVREYFAVVLWGIIPFSMFQGLKGITEVRWVKPLNLYTLVAAIGVQIALTYAVAPFVGLAVAVRYSTLAMLWVMGLLSVWWVRPTLVPLRYWGLGYLGLISLGLLAVNVFLSSYGSLVAFLLGLALSAGLGLAALRYLPKPAFVVTLLAFARLQKPGQVLSTSEG